MYYIATKQLGSLAATEVASITARAIHSMRKDAKTAQFPLVSGGEGTTEHLVTAALGSFLEVEVTGSDSEQVIVPIGFAGDNGSIGILEMRQVSPELPERKTTSRKRSGRPFAGTTAGIGELIRDCLDEGAFSVILGWEEPLASDAGFGMAQALGYKFFGSGDKPLDFRTDTPLAEIKRIDVSERPFQLLSSRFYAARSETVKTPKFAKASGQMTVEDSIMEEELSRIAELLRSDCGITVPSAAIKSGGSYIEFGLQAFLNAEIKDGSMLALEVANLAKSLKEIPGEVIVIAPKLEDIASERASAAMKEVLRLAEETQTGFHAVVLEVPKPASESRYRNKFPLLRSVVSLENDLSAQLDLTLRPSDLRRHIAMRFEKAFGPIVSPQVAGNVETVKQ
jgi:glycerate kinase